MDVLTTSSRDDALAAFVADAGWGDAARGPLAGDASSRRYERLRRPGGESAVVMDAPPADERPACPPGASPEERAALGYNALARLAGPNPVAFVGLSGELVARGFSAPRVLAADVDHGFVLLEDLGDDLFARAIDAGGDPAPMYGAAIDLLAAVRRSTFPGEVSAAGRTWPLLTYDAPALQAEADLFTEWYLPDRLGRPLDETARQAWRAAWAGPLAAVDQAGAGLVLRDVHAENLLWLPQRDGVARAGVIDFQDAVVGHPAYDLVSLLQDARRDVEPDLAEAMIARFIERACVDDEAAFAAAYAVLGVQRAAKILGIFVRLDVRDGKPVYRRHLPRVARWFATGLSHPALADVAAWVRAHAPELLQEAA